MYSAEAKNILFEWSVASRYYRFASSLTLLRERTVQSSHYPIWLSIEAIVSVIGHQLIRARDVDHQNLGKNLAE